MRARRASTPSSFRAYDRLLLIYYVARRNGINDLSVAQGALDLARRRQSGGGVPPAH